MEKISESSIKPEWMECQLAPPSTVFQGKWGVPAYNTLASEGSKVRAVMSCISGSASLETLCQCSPPSALEKTPLEVPAATTRGSRGHIASDSMRKPRSPRELAPVLAAVRTFINARVRRIAGIQARIEVSRLFGIHHQGIEDARVCSWERAGGARKRPHRRSETTANPAIPPEACCDSGGRRRLLALYRRKDPQASKPRRQAG